MNINKTDYLFRRYARIHVFLHAKKDIMRIIQVLAGGPAD